MKKIVLYVFSGTIFLYLVFGLLVLFPANMSHYSFSDYVVLAVLYVALFILALKLLKSAKEVSKAPIQTGQKSAEPLTVYLKPKTNYESNRNPSTFPEILESQNAVDITAHHIDDEENYPLPKGTSLTYLDAEALQFWSKKRTDFEIPTYYCETSFGRNVGPALNRLLSNEYLTLGNMEQRISLKTVPELKAILADRELKTTGRKKELVSRILENFDFDTLEDLFSVNVYCITEKGKEALEPYSIVEDSKAHSLGLSYYRLLQAKEKNPENENNTILTQLLLEDVQQCQRDQDCFGYQAKITTAARFFHEIGEDQLSFECYALSFFMWTRDMAQFGITNETSQSYFICKRLEEVGLLCGYDINQLVLVFQDIVSKKNPFGLGTPDNIRYSSQIFKKSLGVELDQT